MILWLRWFLSLMAIAFVLPTVIGQGAVLFRIFVADKDSVPRKKKEELIAEEERRRRGAGRDFAERAFIPAPPGHPLELPSPEPEPFI